MRPSINPKIFDQLGFHERQAPLLNEIRKRFVEANLYLQNHFHGRCIPWKCLFPPIRQHRRQVANGHQPVSFQSPPPCGIMV